MWWDERSCAPFISVLLLIQMCCLILPWVPQGLRLYLRLQHDAALRESLWYLVWFDDLMLRWAVLLLKLVAFVGRLMYWKVNCFRQHGSGWVSTGVTHTVHGNSLTGMRSRWKKSPCPTLSFVDVRNLNINQLTDAAPWWHMTALALCETFRDAWGGRKCYQNTNI